MKKTSLSLLICILFTTAGFTQNVAINNDGSMPDANAALDIKANGKGLLLPRMSTSNRLSIPNTKGLLVYDTGTSSFWYNTGTVWQNIAAGNNGGTSAGAWALTGNGYTKDSGYFLGTTDFTPLNVKVNNFLSGRIDPDMQNAFWGYKAGISSTTTISQSDRDTGRIPGLTAIGYTSLFSNTTGIWNTAAGKAALYSNTTGTGNTAVGHRSLSSNNTGNYNTATGYESMFSNTGSYNTACGANALQANSTGGNNTANGSSALISNTTGYNNTAGGSGSLLQTNTGHDNTAFGFETGSRNTDGSYNTFIGSNPLGIVDQLGSANTFIGCYTSGGQYTNSTVIGYFASVNASNKVRIGNSAVTVIEGQVPFTVPSDGRFKYDVQEDVRGLDFVLKLRPVTYRFDVSRFDAQHGNPQEAQGSPHKNDVLQAAYNEASLIRRSGFIAQEVEKAAIASGYDFSGIITPKTEQEHYSLSYESFVVPLVKAVQEQQKTIDAQNKKLAGLQQQLDEVKQLLQHPK